MNIFIGNLGYSVTDNELLAAFEAYGEVDSAKVIMDRDTGRSKGFGFVEMDDRQEALAAIEGLNESELGERNINVNEARPKPKNSNRSGGRGGYGGGNRSGGYGGGRSRY